MSYNFQNKPMFQNTMNFLGRKIALEDRAKEVERKRKEIDRIREIEWGRQDWRDKVKRVQKLIDIKNNRIYDEEVFQRNKKYDLEQKGLDIERKKNEYEQKRKDRITDAAIIDNNRRKINQGDTLKEIKLKAKYIGSKEPDGVIEVDDEDNPILADDIEKVKSISDKHSRGLAVASGEYSKAYNNLPNDLKKIIGKNNPENIKDLNSIIANYSKKYRNVNFKSRGKFTKEKSNISTFRDKFNTQHGLVTKLKEDLNQNSKKVVGYKKKKKYSAEREVKDINKLISEYKKQIESTNDRDIAKALTNKITSLYKKSNSLLKSEIEIEKERQKSETLKNKFRAKAQNKIDRTTLKLEYIKNKELKKIFPTFDSYLKHEVNKLTEDLIDKDQIKKIK